MSKSDKVKRHGQDAHHGSIGHGWLIVRARGLVDTQFADEETAFESLALGVAKGRLHGGRER